MRTAIRIDRTLGSPGHEEALAAGYAASPHVNPHAVKVRSPFYVILYLLEGAGEYILPDGRKWELAPGALVQRMPDQVETVIRDLSKHWVEFYLVLPATLFSALTTLGTIDRRSVMLHPGITGLTATRIEALLRNMRHESGVSTAQILAEAHALLAHLFDMDRERRRDSTEAVMVRRARQLLNNNLELRLDMPSVAAELGMGYEAFRKTFRRLAGVSPKEFRIRRRIDLARHMLSVEKCSVKDIAYRLGYPDVALFVKQFKRVVRITPKRFRDAE